MPKLKFDFYSKIVSKFQVKQINNLLINQVSGGVQLSQRQLVMILIVQHIHQIRIERMHIIQFRKLGQNLRQTIVKTLLCKLDFAHVKRAYPCDFVLFVDDSGRFALRFR